MNSRRNFIKNAILSSGALAINPSIFAQSRTINTPKRFIFIHKGNGLFPTALVPTSLSKKEQEMEKRKESFECDLTKNDLPDWMASLNEHKPNLTILQGLSGKMCTTGHHTWQSSLGVYKANERPSSIKWATVDFELAKLYPSPLEHVELACFPGSGGNSRGNIDGIEKGFSARGPQQPNYAFGSPKIAMQELFKSVADNENARIQYELERKILEFTSQNEISLATKLAGLEQSKIKNYAESIESIRNRNAKIDLMANKIKKHIPTLNSKYFDEELSTIDRQDGHAEILLSTLISGMTNVATFTVDELGTAYTGLDGIEKEIVNLHDVGHGKPVGKVKAIEVREKVRRQHMRLVDIIVKKLKDVPEDGGTMFDNTMIFYFPDNGETHHSRGTEWPFIILAGNNCKLDIAGKYIRLPKYGDKGHKTLGNWYTTILNAYGNQIPHYGELDAGLAQHNINQLGSIKQFLT